MSYTVINFKTKKALKEAVKTQNDSTLNPKIRCYNPGIGPDLSSYTGKVSLEGPHYPEPHRWYAQGEMVDGVLVKVS